MSQIWGKFYQHLWGFVFKQALFGQIFSPSPPRGSHLSQFHLTQALNLSQFTRSFWGKNWFERSDLCKIVDISQLCPTRCVIQALVLWYHIVSYSVFSPIVFAHCLAPTCGNKAICRLPRQGREEGSTGPAWGINSIIIIIQFNWFDLV